jgi:hypothetical protein
MTGRKELSQGTVSSQRLVRSNWLCEWVPFVPNSIFPLLRLSIFRRQPPFRLDTKGAVFSEYCHYRMQSNNDTACRISCNWYMLTARECTDVSIFFMNHILWYFADSYFLKLTLSDTNIIYCKTMSSPKQTTCTIEVMFFLAGFTFLQPTKALTESRGIALKVWSIKDQTERSSPKPINGTHCG